MKITVKYAGPCSRCGSPLHPGEQAVWNPAARTIRCVGHCKHKRAVSTGKQA